MKIHFVCTGNTYRSRMAEAYLNSKQLPAIIVSSSGTHASENLNGPISWVAAWVLKKNSLTGFMSSHWTQTTVEILNKADKAIFINADNYEFCKNELNYKGVNYEIWNVLDIPVGLNGDIKIMEKASETFKQIQEKVDELVLSF